MLLISCQPLGECLVQLDMGNVLAGLTFMLALAVQTWAIVRYMIGRMDSHREITNTEINKIHDRINAVKDDYVKRVDIDRDLSHIQSTVTEINNNVNSQMSGMNNRLDILLSTLVPTKVTR